MVAHRLPGSCDVFPHRQSGSKLEIRPTAAPSSLHTPDLSTTKILTGDKQRNVGTISSKVHEVDPEFVEDELLFCWVNLTFCKGSGVVDSEPPKEEEDMTNCGIDGLNGSKEMRARGRHSRGVCSLKLIQSKIYRSVRGCCWRRRYRGRGKRRQTGSPPSWLR
jgi:hypothetical protein